MSLNASMLVSKLACLHCLLCHEDGHERLVDCHVGFPSVAAPSGLGRSRVRSPYHPVSWSLVAIHIRLLGFVFVLIGILELHMGKIFTRIILITN